MFVWKTEEGHSGSGKIPQYVCRVARASGNFRDCQRLYPWPCTWLARWSQSSPRVDLPAQRSSKKGPQSSSTVNLSKRTVLERLTFSRPVSSRLTNRERDRYEITIALCSPLQLSRLLLTSPSHASMAPCAFQSKVKRFIDIDGRAHRRRLPHRNRSAVWDPSW